MSAVPQRRPENTDNVIPLGTDLKSRMRITEQARYNGSRRLRTHAVLSNFSMITVSLELIILSLYMSLMNPPASSLPMLNFSSMVLTVVALALSIVLTMSDFSLRAEKMRVCARDIKHLKDRLEDPEEKDHGGKIRAEYYNLLEKNEPHSYFDYRKAAYDSRFNFQGSEVDLMTFVHLLPAFSLYALIVTAPFALTVFLLR